MLQYVKKYANNLLGHILDASGKYTLCGKRATKDWKKAKPDDPLCEFCRGALIPEPGPQGDCVSGCLK